MPDEQLKNPNNQPLPSAALPHPEDDDAPTNDDLALESYLSGGPWIGDYRMESGEDG